MKLEISNLTSQVKCILDDALFLNGQTKLWGNQMSLLGNVAELDSMSVMNVVAAIRINFGIFMDDEDINAKVFSSLESLANYINEQLSSSCHQEGCA